MSDSYLYAPEYTTGNYLHRLYLAKNPLIANINTTSGVDKAATVLQKARDNLIAQEDKLLSSFASQYGAGSTPEEGLNLINNLLAGSETALYELSQIVINYLKTNSGKIDFNNEGVRSTIIEAMKSILEDKKMGKNTYEASLQEGYENLYQQMINSLDALTKDTAKNIKNAYTFEGFVHELIVTGLFNMNLVDYVNSNQTTLQNNILEIFQNMATEAAAKAVGDTSVASKVKATGRYSAVDMTIPVMEPGETLNLQLKAKPRSTQPTIRLQSSMAMEDLISNNINGADRLAIKTALINQHFWGLKGYKNLVKEIVNNSSEMKGEYSNLSSALPTALERLDYSTTLDVLQPVIPVLEQAIFYNVVTGIAEDIDVHLYVITGQKGYEVQRSSTFLNKLMDDGHSDRDVVRKGKTIGTKKKGLDSLKASGRLVITGKEAVSSGNVFGNRTNLPRNKWYNAVSSITEAAYHKMAVTLTFDYSSKK